MPRTGDNTSNIAFCQQGTDMIITVWHKEFMGQYYDNATHRLKPDEIRQLRDECVKCIGATDD